MVSKFDLLHGRFWTSPIDFEEFGRFSMVPIWTHESSIVLAHHVGMVIFQVQTCQWNVAIPVAICDVPATF